MTKQTDTAIAAQSAAIDSKIDWYKDAIIYQLHVKSFFDSDNDGIGDFIGLTKKLDYLQDLGVTAIWLMPFYPSPLRDDGYDIADYRDVHPSYGKLRHFQTFVKEAHARGLRVITELVINHTSDQHAWFQKARRAKPGSAAREMYVWTDNPERYKDARIIFKDFESSNWSWDPVAGAYYWHRFYAHQPDLNFDNPAVHEAVLATLDFWMEFGIDGFRLDAIPYLYEREETNCENLPETHAFLKLLRKHIDEKYPGRMLLAEANQWPEDAVAYFGEGDECHTAFHFPVMPRLFMAIHQEDSLPVLDILQQTPAIPDNCQWVIFLRNHDELTLEMVTDEERDYMYRAYALDRQARVNLGIRRRLAPLLSNHRAKIELMNGLLFSLPGTPVIYYGDEIGMGDNIYLGDRHGVRTPMQWSPDRNAGFSDANSQRLFAPVIIDSEYLFETVNVETQQQNPDSLLWWTRRLIAVRQRYPAFGRGTFEPLSPDNPKVLAFVRRFEDQILLVVANLSRYTQYAEIDLSAFAPRWPVELFGQSRFPQIGKAPYVLTLAPYVFHWFSLVTDLGESVPTEELPKLNVQADWTELFSGRLKRSLGTVVGRDLARRHWDNVKTRGIQAVSVQDSISCADNKKTTDFVLTFVRVDYLEGEPENYLLLLGAAWGEDAEKLAAARSDAVIARLSRRSDEKTGILFDALLSPAGANALLEIAARRRRIKGEAGELRGSSIPELAQLVDDEQIKLVPNPLAAEQTNSSIVFGDRLICKVVRRAEPGENPELEIARALARATSPVPIAPFYGAIEYHREKEKPTTVGILHGYLPNTISARQLALDWLGRYLEKVISENTKIPSAVSTARRTLWEMSQGDPPAAALDLIGASLELATLLGKRTGELHAAIASVADLAFTVETCTPAHQRELYQAARKRLSRTMLSLRRAKNLSESTQALAREVLSQEKKILENLHDILSHPVIGPRIRCHGDYHLGQVLYTGKDFVIIDFEGAPERPFATRRTKESPLCDVAAMIRSLHYVAMDSLARFMEIGGATPSVLTVSRAAVDFWYTWNASAFLKGYRSAVSETNLLPESEASINRLIGFHMLVKNIDELHYELSNRPTNVATPLYGILELLAG